MKLVKQPKPFVKWAGGKTQLLDQLLLFSPKGFENYYEPFVGGGAFFFKLSSENKIKRVFINDVNEELITAYRVIKERPCELIEELSKTRYVNTEKYFYEIRDEKPQEEVEATARFIYLNKTAFNGLYRVNSSGKFNTPFGKYSNPKILDVENILAVHNALQKDEITCLDFEEAVSTAWKKDFVYFDPPYQPISKTSSFTKYTSQDFTEKDQVRLLQCFKRLDRKGCYVMLSNSYSEFIKEIYSEFTQHTVRARRAINCVGSSRGNVNELIITNYEVYKWEK